MTPAARILALVLEEAATVEDIEAHLRTPYMEERVTLLLAELDAERAEAQPVWSPG